MTDSQVTLILGIATQVSVVILGWWAYKAKVRVEAAALVAKQTASVVAGHAADVKATVEQTAVVMEEVRSQTDGRLSEIEKMLRTRDAELKRALDHNDRLLAKLQAVRDGTLAPNDIPSVRDPT